MDIRAQVNRVYDNIEIALQAAGATWDNVVKTTTYLTDAAFIKDFRDVRTEGFKSFKAPPANTLIVANRLAEPEFLVEIEAIAAVPVA
jgi:enamine deaminase RidA (YjgF/YER057c/UK114 family)